MMMIKYSYIIRFRYRSVCYFADTNQEYILSWPPKHTSTVGYHTTWPFQTYSWLSHYMTFLNIQWVIILHDSLKHTAGHYTTWLLFQLTVVQFGRGKLRHYVVERVKHLARKVFQFNKASFNWAQDRLELIIYIRVIDMAMLILSAV